MCCLGTKSLSTEAWIWQTCSYPLAALKLVMCSIHPWLATYLTYVLLNCWLNSNSCMSNVLLYVSVLICGAVCEILSVNVVVDNWRSALFSIMCMLCEGGVRPWGMCWLTDTPWCSSQRSWRARSNSAPHGCNVWPRCTSRNAFTGVVASLNAVWLTMVHREHWTHY